MSRIVQNAVLNSSPLRTFFRGLVRRHFSLLKKWTHNKHLKNNECEEDCTSSQAFCFSSGQQNGAEKCNPSVQEELGGDGSCNSSEVDHHAFQFNSGVLYNNLIKYMRPQVPLSQRCGHDIAAVPESGRGHLKIQEGAAATAVRGPLLLIERRLHKVRCQRTFAFDKSRTSALTFIPSSHENFCRVFSYLHRKDQNNTVDTLKKDEGRIILTGENMSKAQLEKKVVEFSQTYRLVKDAQKILDLALRQFYASFESKKADKQNLHSLTQTMSAKYHDWNSRGDESGGFSNKELKIPSNLRGSKPLMICARAHKNIGYALHFLQLANQSLHKANITQTMDNQKHKKDHSNFLYQAVILLEAADGNLRMLFRHLKAMTKEDIGVANRRGRKRGGNSGSGPRSLVLRGNIADGGNMGQKLFHTLSFNRTRQYFLETKIQNQLYLANHSSKKEDEVPVQEIEILALLSKVDGLGRFLQEIHDNYTNKRGSKEVISKEIEMLVFLLKAHKQLCEIITQMNIILASLERDRRIKKKLDEFIEEPRSDKCDKEKEQKGGFWLKNLDAVHQNNTKGKKDKKGKEKDRKHVKSTSKKDKQESNEKANIKLSVTDDTEGGKVK